jgi:hypothetical protein
MYQFRDVPLTPAVISELLVEMIGDGSVPSTFKRGSILEVVQRTHLSRGGRPASGNPQTSFKKALANMREAGILEQPSMHFWRVKRAPSADGLDKLVVAGEHPVLTPDPAIPPSELTIEEELGEGAQALYVYYYPNDRALAAERDLSVWECKVGMTTGTVDGRIIGQISSTSIHTRPIVGLVVRTDNARALEQLLHGLLRYAQVECGSAGTGTEWFLTSPSAIKTIVAGLTDLTIQAREGFGRRV